MSHLVLVANCFPVKGYTRSIICDTIRNKYEFVPNSLYEFLKKYNKARLTEIRKDFDDKDWKIIESYLEFLSTNEFIFFSTQPELFPEVEIEWDSPTLITNAVLDFDSRSSHDVGKIIAELNEFRCEALEIRTFEPLDCGRIREILEHTKESSLRSVFLFLRYHEHYSYPFLDELLLRYRRVMHIIIHSAPDFLVDDEKNKTHFKIVYSSQKIGSEEHCGAISKWHFCNNMAMFMESHFYNSCLNKKISVDKKGYIKNCPSANKEYGHHKTDTLKSALENASFKEKWNITKDAIAVCKDCEFRYICTDCRVYTQKPEDPFSKPMKCSYDPYSAVWT